MKSFENWSTVKVASALGLIAVGISTVITNIAWSP